MRTAVVDGVVVRAIEWVVRNPVFRPFELRRALGLSDKERDIVVRRLLELGVVYKLRRGEYMLRGEFVEALLFFASGKSLAEAIEEFLEGIS